MQERERERIKRDVTAKIEEVIQQLQEIEPVAISAYLHLPADQHQAHWQKIDEDQKKIDELRRLANIYALILVPDDIKALLKRFDMLASEKHNQMIPDESGEGSTMIEDTKSERQRVLEAGQTALNWQDLYNWTVNQPKCAVLGQSCTNSLDPLNSYLGAATNTRPGVWSVGPSIKTGYGDRLNKPDWIKSLIEETDQATGKQSGPVTRELYLTVLDRVKPGI